MSDEQPTVSEMYQSLAEAIECGIATNEQLMKATVQCLASDEYKKLNRWYRWVWRWLKEHIIELLLRVAN